MLPAPVKLTITAELLHSSYREDVDLWATFFVPRPFAMDGQHTLNELFHPKEHKVSGTLLAYHKIPRDAPLFMWIYTERAVRASQAADFHEDECSESSCQPVQWGVARVGYAVLKLTASGAVVTARHLSGEAAATLRVTVTGAPPAATSASAGEYKAPPVWTVPSDIPGTDKSGTESKWAKLPSNVLNIRPTGTDTTRLPCGVVPMWSFFWAPTQNRNYDPESKTFNSTAAERAETLWLRLADYGCLLTGITREQLVKNASPMQLAEVIAAAAAALPRASLFSPDTYVESDSKEIIEFDQWTLFDNHPTPGRVIYDCEDGAGLIMELLHVLRVCPFRSKEMLRLQEFARQYYACVAIGTMKSAGGRVVNHCYVQMLSKRYVDHLCAATETETKEFNPETLLEQYPPFVIESSVYADACISSAGPLSSQQRWNLFGESRAPDGLAAQQQSVLKGRVRVPAGFIVAEEVYEFTYALFCPELTNQRADQTPAKLELVYEGKSGAATRLLMLYDKQVSAQVTRCSSALRRDVLQVFDHMPRWSLPRAVDADTEPVPRVDASGRVLSSEHFFRGWDWDHFKELRDVVKEDSGAVVQEIALATDVRVVRIVREVE